MNEEDRKALEARALEGDHRTGGSFAPLLLILAALAGGVALIWWLLS